MELEPIELEGEEWLNIISPRFNGMIKQLKKLGFIVKIKDGRILIKND